MIRFSEALALKQNEGEGRDKQDTGHSVHEQMLHRILFNIILVIRQKAETIKKLSLLLAFLGKPALIVLDEPYDSLDEAGRAAMDALIEEYRCLYRTGFLMSSHAGNGHVEPPYMGSSVCLVLFGILYVGVLGSFLILLSGSFLVTALLLFKRGY
jgi:hypothetical protein